MPFTERNLAIPSTNKGNEDLKALTTDRINPASFGERPLASGDTMECDITNAPTPTSMIPLPKVSVFANRRGRMTKSTASITIDVAINTYALNAPMKGLLPDMSEARIFLDCFCSCFSHLFREHKSSVANEIDKQVEINIAAWFESNVLPRRTGPIRVTTSTAKAMLWLKKEATVITKDKTDNNKPVSPAAASDKQ